MSNKTQKIYKTNKKNDFYSFINKKWLNKTKIPEDKINQSQFSNLSKKVSKQLKDIIKKDAPNLLSIFKPTWDDKEVEEMIIILFNQIEDLRIENDIYKLFAFLIKNGFGNIISLNIQQFIYDPKKRIISIDAESQTFPPIFKKGSFFLSYK